MPQGTAGGQHLQVTLGESIGRILIDRIQRIDQAVAEGIGVDVERRMDEVGDIGPVVPVPLVEAQGRTQALGLDASDPAFWDKGLGVIRGFIDDLERQEG